MGGDDYSTVGGSLRLKGSAGVVKKKKKKSSKLAAAPKDDGKTEAKERQPSNDRDTTSEAEQALSGSSKPGDTLLPKFTKTEAERKFEEARRKKLDKVLMKDAGKSHKEKVEEFNKYLANLSEHHDMPRIGPG